MKNTPIHQQELLDQNQISYLELWISFYSKKNNLNITIDNTLEAPAAVPDTTTGAMPTIIINPNLCMQKLNLTQEELLMVMFHEIEHLKEDSHLISTPEGQRIANQRKFRQKSHGKRASSYHFIENILRDVFVNTQVVDTENIPIFSSVLHNLYKTKLFATIDYTKDRKHKQFGYAIVREAFVPEEQCIVDSKVRKIINRFQKSGIIEKSTTGSFSQRLLNIRNLIEPTYKKLLEEDKEKYEEEKKNKENENKSGENSDKKGKDNKDNKNPQKGEKSSDPQEGKPKQGEVNPFEDDYKEIPDHILEDVLDPKDMEKLKKQLEEQVKEDKKPTETSEQKELKHEAKRMLEDTGKDPNDKDELESAIEKLKEYKDNLKKIKEIKDFETGKSVIDEIVGIFEKIKSQKYKMKYFSKSPVDLEHGTRLFGSAIAKGIGDVYGGNTNPEMFEMDSRREKINEGSGLFEISLIADGTGSMEGEKNFHQKQAILLTFEALKQLHDKIQRNKEQLTKSMEFKTEGYIFGSEYDEQQKKIIQYRKIKELKKDFLNNERLEVYDFLNKENGPDNNEGLLLEKIYQEYLSRPEQERKKIKQGKIKKILFVFTDGGQDVEEYKQKLTKHIQLFREAGIMVYGIGIGDDADLSWYQTKNTKLGGAEPCKDPSQLAQVLKKLLSTNIGV